MTVTRVGREFSSGGATRAAWLYLPDGPGPHACVVMAHGVAATGAGSRLGAYAERFAQAGIASYLFDHRQLGEPEGEHGQLRSIRRQLEDWRAAVGSARAVDAVDAERIALWGTSVSGGPVLVLAARDPRITAVIAQSPHVGGFTATVGSTGSAMGAAAVRSAPAAKSAVGRRGEALTVLGHEDGATAWITLRLPSCPTGGPARRITASVLYCLADLDELAPVRATLAVAEGAPRAEIRRYPAGHLQPSAGALFEQVVGDQIDFLTRHLRVAR